MDPLYECIEGHVLFPGYAPDGDSIRFLPKDFSALERLRRAPLLRWSDANGSVQVRLEGIDAPELHYAESAQPRGGTARDALFAWLGVTNVHCLADGATIADATPPGVACIILANAIDPHGRVIGYLLQSCPSPGARRHRVDVDLVRKTANHALVASGAAYPLAYRSQPPAHRAAFREAARRARSQALGVWRDDVTARGFALRGARSIGPGGALVFPKIFRRGMEYFIGRTELGFAGTFVDWLRAHGSGGSDRIDRVNLAHAANVPLWSIIGERDRFVTLERDVLELVWVES
jgi:endonuclease YncB( thermonuclease family)